MAEITQALVREFFNYNPETGDLAWRKLRPDGKPRSTGNLNRQGYRTIYFYGGSKRVHRLIWLYVYGELPPLSRI